MNKLKTIWRWAFILLGFITLVGVIFWRLSPQPDAPPVQAKFTGLEASQAGFTRAEGPTEFNFPEDLGAHPDFQTEWWYYTGNLDSVDGRHFGYQLTFFRRALVPPDETPARMSDWAAGQVYMAHFTLTDVQDTRFYSFERLERGAAGLAGAVGSLEFRVWLDEWSVEQTGEGMYRLSARQGDLSIELELEDIKGIILQGEEGYSRKGPQPGNASYYTSQTALSTHGQISLGSKTYSVLGKSWMDHEYSTSALSEGQTGWDWFALQLENGTELMAYQIRRSDGEPDPYSSGTLVYSDSNSLRLGADDFQIQVLDTWNSPHSGAEYPSGWRIEVSSLGLSLEIIPYLKDQENLLSFTYWEGAVRVRGEMDGQPVSGSGYVELTGYSGTMAGQF